MVVSCSGPGDPVEPAQAPEVDTSELQEGVLSQGEGEVSHQGLTVVVADDVSVSLSVAELTEATAEGLLWLLGQGVAISPPMLVTTDAAGGVLIKEFPEPLPEDWGAGFMTINEESGEFEVVQAVLADDRRSMRAQVEHFSKWWDFLAPAEIGETMRAGWTATVTSTKDLQDKATRALVDAAERADYLIGGVLTTRVDPPSCSNTRPSWTSDVVFIETHFNNPIHFCAGSAPGDSSILEIKVRINRGVGMTVTTAARPVWAANTTYSGIGDGVAALASDVSLSMANGLGAHIEGGSFLGAGQEATIRFDEASVRAASNGPLVTVDAPTPLTFAVGQLASLLTTAGLSQMDATTLALVGVASCQAEMMRTSSPADAAFGAAKCGMTYLADHPNEVSRATGGRLTSAALRRASLVLTAASASQNALAYLQVRDLVAGGRTVNVTTTLSGPGGAWTTCEHPDGFALTYPFGWQTYDGRNNPDLSAHHCSLFGTATIEVWPGGELPWVPIRVHVWDGLPFEAALNPQFRGFETGLRDVSSREATVAGRPAVRLVSVSEAEEASTYALPRGVEVVSWYVDLSTDTTDRVLLGRAIPLAEADTGATQADKSAPGAESVEPIAKVLDAMMASLVIAD